MEDLVEAAVNEVEQFHTFYLVQLPALALKALGLGRQTRWRSVLSCHSRVRTSQNTACQFVHWRV